MEKFYLILNAVVYAGLAALCTFRDESSAHGCGYTKLTPGGRSEYLTVYGGLQMGVALAYFCAALNPAFVRPAILFSVCLYAPIVLYRVITVLAFKVRAPVTLGTGALEVFMLGFAIVLAVHGR